MARSIEAINNQLKSDLVLNFATVGISIDVTTWSKRNFFRLICYTVAVSIGMLEQLMDLYQQILETIVARAPAASPLWVQKKMFEFQYSATDPQVIALIDVVPTYPVVDPSLRIITACTVISPQASIANIKVAKGSPLEPLTTLERDSAQGYINTIGVMGIEYIVVSLPSDKLYIEADIYYAGQYAAVIQQQVIDSIDTFLETLSINSFVNNINGSLKMTDLEGFIRNIEGVNDVLLKNVRGREDSASFSAGIDLILNNATVQRQWDTIAGYIGQEDTPTKTFADTLNFIAQ